MKLGELADSINAELHGNREKEISYPGKIENANSSEITFLASSHYEKYFKTSKAGAIIVTRKFFDTIKNDTDKDLLIVEDPYFSFVNVLKLFDGNNPAEKHFIHETAVLDNSCKYNKDKVFIGAGCVIGANCSIGDNTVIYPGTIVMDNVTIGSDVIIYPNVTVYKDCIIGNKVIIHSGSVIGSDGFGQVKTKDGRFDKIPQLGNVIIEDDVEIGSNCSIDRATVGETRLCKGVKLDNQIQIAHNVIIGENTVIAAQTGIAGSTKVGKNCMIGGQVGIVGHIEICDNVIITASVGVSKSITEPGIYSGYRAQPMKQELRREAIIRNLEKIINDLKK